MSNSDKSQSVESESTCSICSEKDCDFETRCNHFFHKNCLEGKVIYDYLSCPNCATRISLNSVLEKVIRDPSLINENLDIDVLNSLVEYSANQNNLDLFKKLNGVGANIHYKDDKFPDGALDAFGIHGNLDAIKYMLDNGADIDDALIKCVEGGKLEIIKYLVEKGANFHDDYDYVFKRSASNGNLELVKYFIECGTDIHTAGKSALWHSAFYGNLDVVKFLVEKGADIHDGNDSLFFDAIEGGSIEVVKYFVECGADIHMLQTSYPACDANNLEMIKFLIECNSHNKEYIEVAIENAKDFGRTEIIEYLNGLIEEMKEKK